MTDINILQDFDNYYKEAYYAWDSFYPEAETDLRFYLGDQWSEDEKRKLFEENRNAFVFNRCFRNINMITGYQRKNRLSSVTVPVENSDQKTSDLKTKLLLYVMNKCNGYNTISDVFAGGLKTGWNLMSIWMDYTEDPINGDIKFGREPYNSFICDPYFTELNWSDCNYIIKRKYLSPEMASSMLPKMEKEIYEIHSSGWERDDKFTWLPYQRQPNGQDLLAYNELFIQKWKNVPYIVDMQTGEYTEFDRPKKDQEEMLAAFSNLSIIKKPKKYIEKYIIINDVFLKKEINPYGLNEYPFSPFIPIFEPESDQWSLKVQSLIRPMRDPQKESNRRRSQMSDLLDSNVNSGWIADENSVVNPQSLFQTSQGKVIWRRQDAKPGALEKIPPGQIPPSMFQLQEVYDKDITEIIGINEAAYGATENAQESGVMMMLRQGAAINNLQTIFDNLNVLQKSISLKALKLIESWTPEKIKRITGEDPTDQFYDKESNKYDISVQQGILTNNQQQMYFRQLVELKQLGAPVSGEMLAKEAPIQGKSDYIEQLSQAEQQQSQQAQQQAKIQEQVLQSQLEYNKASSLEKISGAKERYTRAVANMGLEDERASKSIENRTDAALSRAKAIKELESLDEEKLLRYLTIIRMMEENSRLKEEEIKKDDIQISSNQEVTPKKFSNLQEQIADSGGMNNEDAGL